MEQTYEPTIFEEEISVKYGGFWERFGALFLDGLILLPFTLLNLYNHTAWKSLPVLLILNILPLVYKPLLEYLYGATPGKKALSLTVVNTGYGKLNAQEAVLRNIFGIVLGMVSIVMSVLLFTNPHFAEVHTMADYAALEKEIGFSTLFSGSFGVIYIVDAIVLAVDKQKRSLHDMIAKTYVIKQIK